MADSAKDALPRHQGGTVELELRTSATPEQIWNAWADPSRISQWFADSAEGWATKGREVTWIFDEFGYRLPYHVIESMPEECVVFGGQLPGRMPFMLEVTIRRAGGETIVRLVNSGFMVDADGSFDEEYEGIASGWQLALAMLKYYAEHHYGVDKQQFLLMREAEFDLTRLPFWYTRPELLNRWLTTSALVGAAGERCLLHLQNGPVIDGVVAGITRREAGFIWSSANAMVELKGWSAGPRKLLAIRVTGWQSPSAAALRPVLEQALDRLVPLVGAGAS
jgi:uncharacterized protein YndB with AHSA1/START domain